ncbi:hypothetical protein GCM10027277_56610 [Pseudoduganella ginsengisoli]|uniref:Uncharacterized protein n=1 Tax=Pseudoduganella ginsengisoli TaxID=1462440 RepID=A0A6L6Q2Y0_9BURK|nr:hypothetical protein [Pseudoduganella ginsengisoli]MTW03965.1 hypothetical protein [Pseudoduganella ginsengisoli]
MNEATDLKLEDTKLFTLYFHELWWLAHAIKTKAEKLFDEAKVPDNGYAMQVSPELHSLIASILSDAANLKKLLITASARLNGKSGRQYRLRKARAAALRALTSNVPLKEMLNAKVRNTLEHFDEYLDEANVSLSQGKLPPSPMAAYNMVISHWEVFDPPVYPIRLYVSVERKFYNMKWSVDIDAIYKEASALVDCLALYLKFANGEGPGGLMLRLG